MIKLGKYPIRFAGFAGLGALLLAGIAFYNRDILWDGLHTLLKGVFKNKKPPKPEFNQEQFEQALGTQDLKLILLLGRKIKIYDNHCDQSLNYLLKKSKIPALDIINQVKIINKYKEKVDVNNIQLDHKATLADLKEFIKLSKQGRAIHLDHGCFVNLFAKKDEKLSLESNINSCKNQISEAKLQFAVGEITEAQRDQLINAEQAKINELTSKINLHNTQSKNQAESLDKVISVIDRFSQECREGGKAIINTDSLAIRATNILNE